MKTGLLLLQSIATSALRTGPSKRSLFTGRSWPVAFQHSSSPSSCDPATRSGIGATAVFASVAGVGLVGAGTATAMTMCSNDSGSVETVTTVDASSVSSTRQTSIDDPLKHPQHDPSFPFPESSLKHDTYNGVTLDISKLPIELLTYLITHPDSFHEMLTLALDAWQEQHRRGIWIRIPTTHSHLIHPSTTLGFDFQHAEPGSCILTKWLPSDTPSRLPNGPTHQVGIGALVIHPITGKMLAVQERTGPAAARKLWKMPTGLTDPGEDIASAAIRELKEETGLDCVFDKIICFRQAHGGLFNRSDMFFVCLCKLSSKYDEVVRKGEDIEILPQEEEILCADWMEMEDYAEQNLWRESPLYKEMNGAMLRAARRGIAYSVGNDGEKSVNADGNDDDESHGFVAKELPVGFRPGSNTIYVSSKL